MKVGLTMTYLNKGGYEAPPIVLDNEEVQTLSTSNSLKMKLLSTPGNSNSSTYDLQVKIFTCGSPEAWIKFLKHPNEVFVGQNLILPSTWFSMARRLLDGPALKTFQSHTTGTGFVESDDTLHLVLSLKLLRLSFAKMP